MAMKSQAGVRIRMNRDGSMNIRSYGGVDLRKVLPDLFQQQQPGPEPEDIRAATANAGGKE